MPRKNQEQKAKAAKWAAMSEEERRVFLSECGRRGGLTVKAKEAREAKEVDDHFNGLDAEQQRAYANNVDRLKASEWGRAPTDCRKRVSQKSVLEAMDKQKEFWDEFKQPLIGD